MKDPFKIIGVLLVILLLLVISINVHKWYSVPEVKVGDVWETTLREDSKFEKKFRVYVVSTDEYYVQYSHFPLGDTTDLWVTTKRAFKTDKLISRKK